MNGKLKDWSFSRTGESVLTITTRESCKKLWDALGDQEITFSIKRRVIPRSLNANNYAWSLIEKLAVAVKSDKDSVYEEMLRRYGTGETYTDEAGNECKVLFSLREGVPPALVARPPEAILRRITAVTLRKSVRTTASFRSDMVARETGRQPTEGGEHYGELSEYQHGLLDGQQGRR